MKSKKWFSKTLSTLVIGGLLVAAPLTSFAAESQNHDHGAATATPVTAPKPDAGSHGGQGSDTMKGGKMQDSKMPSGKMDSMMQGDMMAGMMQGDMMSGMMQGTVVDAVYKLTGLEKQEIISRRQAGKSFVEIAKSKGVSEEKLLDAVTKDHDAKIDQKVKAGMMTEEMAKQCKEHFAVKIKDVLNKTDVKTKVPANSVKKGFGSKFKNLQQQVHVHTDKHVG